jgi:PleD family two-component response regulator
MSYGVVQWREGENRHDLFARADQALYRAKAAGKNIVAE